MCVDVCVQGTHTPLGKLSLVVKSANNFFHRFLSLKKKNQELPHGRKRELKNLGSILFCPSICKGLSVALGNPTTDDIAQS